MRSVYLERKGIGRCEIEIIIETFLHPRCLFPPHLIFNIFLIEIQRNDT